MNKQKKPTQSEITDFYFQCLILCDLGYFLRNDFGYIERKFFNFPNSSTAWVDKYKNEYDRETSPETYNLYVSDSSLYEIRKNGWADTLCKYKTGYFKNKIKITICEEE
jgi:hypothetical protein